LGRIPDEIVQQVRDRVDIVDLVGRFVSLKKSGHNHKGLCPFHSEKTPSFNVHSERQSFYCFGCHASGNVFTFLMNAENLTFPEAVRSLARECGIEIPETASGEPGLAERLRAANEFAQARYRAALEVVDSPGAAYLKRRGLDASLIERFGLGFAPEGWDFLTRELSANKISAEVAERAGLLATRTSGGHYDRLRGRVTFPIRDVRGHVIGFGGRALSDDDQPKYLNTPESPIFHKREAFFGFPRALEPIRRSGFAVVVEGYFDLIALCRAGIEGCVASCGTALSEEHGRQLRRRTREVVLQFDGDEAGQRAMQRSLEILLPHGLRVRAAALPAGDDPDSFLAREGAEALRELVEQAPPAFDRVIARAVAAGCATPWQKADAVGAVAPLLALVSDRVERAALCDQLALAVGAEAGDVTAAVRTAARDGDAAGEIPLKARVSSSDERKLRGLARSLLDHPVLAARVPRDEVLALVPVRALNSLLAALLDAARAAGESRLDVEQIASSLEDDARQLLHALAVEESQLDEGSAARTIDDTLAWLRQRHVRERQRELTRQMRSEGADMLSLLQEKQQQLEERRTVHRQPPSGSAT